VEWIWRRSAGLVPGRWSASSLQSARKRSRRALEWSGPCPSYPCGSATTRPDCWPHRSSPVHKDGTVNEAGKETCYAGAEISLRHTGDQQYAVPVSTLIAASRSAAVNMICSTYAARCTYGAATVDGMQT